GIEPFIGTTETEASATPVKVRGLAGAVGTIAAGRRHTCARINERGGVPCWGNNESFQLGGSANDGGGGDEPGGIIPRGQRGTKLAGGEAHACAVDGTGQLLCWGSNQFTQLGHSSPRSPGPPQLIDNIDHVSALGLGATSTCAAVPPTINDTSLRCW